MSIRIRVGSDSAGAGAQTSPVRGGGRGNWSSPVCESTSCRDHARGALPGRRRPNDDGTSRCPGPIRCVSVKKNHRILVGAAGVDAGNLRGSLHVCGTEFPVVRHRPGAQSATLAAARVPEFPMISAAELSALLQVIVVDLVLAGDNAIVVGMAAAGLPAKDRARVIALGIVAATVMRVAFAAVTVQLLQIVGLLLAGGLVLLWVAWKLWREIRTRRESLRSAAAAAPEAGAHEAAALGARAAQAHARRDRPDRGRRRVDVARQRACGRGGRARPHLGAGGRARALGGVHGTRGGVESRASSSTGPGSPTSDSWSSSTWRWR